MHEFFHAFRVFGDQLAAVDWKYLAIGLGLHFVRLFFRAIAWRTILSASYPNTKVKFSSTFGAYLVGVGINSVAPARGGDVVRLYLTKHRIKDASYATLAPTLVVETLADFFIGGAIIVWALVIGALPAHKVYSRLPSVDWGFLIEHREVTGAVLADPDRGRHDRLLPLRRAGNRHARAHRPGLRDPAAPAPFRGRRRAAAARLVGAAHRLALLLPAGVRRAREHPQRVPRPGRRLAGDALPRDARRRRHEAGADRLPLPRPGRPSRCCSRSASA